MINTINDEYTKFKMFFRDFRPDRALKVKVSVSEKIKEIEWKIDPEDLRFEVCDCWLWVTGKTFPFKFAPVPELSYVFKTLRKQYLYYKHKEVREK